MAELWNLSPQSNIESNRNSYVIIVLCDPESTSNNSPRAKSGFRPTSNSFREGRERRRIRKRLKSSTISFSRILDSRPPAGADGERESRYFHDVQECLDYIQSKHKMRFWLLISDRYALDESLMAQFKGLRQIIQISHCQSQVHQEDLKELSITKERLDVMKLPKCLYKTPIESFDDSKKLLLIEHFIEELLIEGSDNDADWHDFLQYCQQRYECKPHVIDEVKKWIAIYDTKDPIHWYSEGGHISFRLVSRVCGTADIEGVILLRHFLCDLYKQLRKLHNDQLNNLKKKPLVVNRGTRLNRAELSWLQNRRTLCLTRPFLSTTKDENMASAFSGDTDDSDGKVSVIITMKIEPQQIKDSLIADISGESAIETEAEFMLARRLVFRVDSVQPSTESNQIIHIQLVRGFEEANIERMLRSKYTRVAMASSCPLLSLISLVSIKKPAVSIVLQPHDVHTQQHYSTIDMENTQDIGNIKLTEDQALSSHPTPNSPEQIVTQGQLAATGNGATSGAVSAATGAKAGLLAMATKPIFLAISVTIVGVVVVASVVIPLAIILPNHNTTNKETTPLCSTTCVFMPFVENPSANYQAEQLNFTCTKTLTNMTLTIIVQRNYNETHAQQYQTFWNQSTNMTYAVTPFEITYQWFSWFHRYIVANSFPHFVRVEYYYTSGFIRVTSNDTWLLTATTICNETITYSGTF